MEKKVDVEAIMKTIRQETVDISDIYKKIRQDSMGEVSDIPTMEKAFSQFADKRVDQILDYVKPRCEIKYYREIENKNPIVKFIKRVMRKLMKFCIYPMSMDQSVFNLNLVEIIDKQQQQIRELRTEIERLSNPEDEK